MRVEAVNGDTITCKFPGAGVEMHCPLFCEKDEIGVLRGRIPEIKEKFTIVSRTFDLEKREHYFTLDCDAVGLVEVGDTIENLSGQAEILIENCTFGIFRGTTRLQSRKKTVVRNCEFRNRDCSLLFTGDTTYWFESGPVEDFLVENCKFLNSNYGPRFNFTTEMEFTDEAKYYHKNVTVRDCYFDGDAVSCLWHVENFHFEHNRAEGTKTIYAKESKGVVADADTIIK